MAPNLLQDSLNALLNSQAIFTVFQPIVDLNRRSPLGYEALTRGEPGNLLQRPDMMFDTAFRYQRLSDLEQLCLSSALSSFEQQSSDALLFINICPESMTQQPELLNDTIQALQKSGLRPEQLVLEISERFPVKNTAELQQALTRYKEAGFAIAIDDLGSGYSGLKLWSDIHPDYVKIDRHFIHKVDQDPVKQAFVNSVVRLCDQLNCRVIAEGIETETELATLRSMGIHLAQGYLLGQPRPALAFSLPQACQQTAEITLQGGLERPIGDLCQPLMCITPDTRMSDADRLFNEIPSLASLPVVKDDVPVGLIRRHTLLEHFSRPYGRALYEKRPVGEFLQKDSVIVESQMSIGHVSKRITDSDGVDLMQPVIITQNGRYQGMVGTRTLLRHITDAQIQTARYANPLTLLPGNVLIDEHIEGLIREQKEFQLLYLDLNHFKPYNDLYGYRQGDAVLKALGNILQQEASDQHFIGHIGGDDFVIVAQESDATVLCQRILGNFLSRSDDFHHPDDIARGYLSIPDREGKQNFVPLLGLAIGVVPSGLIEGKNSEELASLAAQAKKLAKQRPGSHWHCLEEGPDQPSLALVGGSIGGSVASSVHAFEKREQRSA